VEITVRRQNHFRGNGRLRPFGWWYECDGPDGTHFTNTSIVELRSVLRRRYGRAVVIKEEWK
jgi:hypothetical protein